MVKQLSRGKSLSDRGGFALVLVLIAVAMAAVMVALFLASAGRERRGVDFYARGSEVRNLAEMSVNRVLGQINAATKEGTLATPVSWASQPGMVRTFAADGQPSYVYPLYSWDNPLNPSQANLRIPAAGYDPFAAANLPPADWKTQVATYVDLNQSVNNIYPIVDPTTVSPVVQGFTIDGTNVAVAASGSAAPMPVKWLYVLQDGTMVAPSNGSGSTATVTGASTTNPIVGRVAFWTDDETSKVNLNTASEGSYWDWPKAGSRDEMQFAGNPPSKNEFSRVPGHPAMTSLSAVFPEIRNADKWTDGSNFRTELKSIYDFTPRLNWNESSGSHLGGSAGGTYPVNSLSQDYGLTPAYLTSNPVPADLLVGANPLYVSPDDAWFTSALRATNTIFSKLTPADIQKRGFFMTTSSRAPETTLFETPRVSLWPVTWPNPSAYTTYARFIDKATGKNSFVTAGTGSATSTGQAVPTAGNPTDLIENNPWMTSVEKLLAFDATINKSGAAQRFYFQRKDPDSPTNDWGIARNKELTNYVLGMMRKNEPGFVGGSLASKWGDHTAAWIALNCFDYVRSQINQSTPNGPLPSAPPGGQGYLKAISYSYTGTKANVLANYDTYSLVQANAGTVVPLHVTDLDGDLVSQGSFPALKEVGLVFHATQRATPAPIIPGGGIPVVSPARERYLRNPFNWKNLINPGVYLGGVAVGGIAPVLSTAPLIVGYPTGAQTTEMKAVMMFNFTSIVPDVSTAPFFWVKVTGSLNADGQPLNFSGKSVRIDSTVASIPAILQPMMNGVSKTSGLVDNLTPKTFGGASAYNVWSLLSAPIGLSATSLNFSFGGSMVKIEIFAPNPADLTANTSTDSTKLVASYDVDFGSWSQSLPIPVAPMWNVASPQNITAPKVATIADPANWPGTADGYTTPDSQPCPTFSISELNKIDHRTPPPVALNPSPETRDTRWAYSEYVPNYSTSAGSTSVVTTGTYSQFNTARVGYTPYAYTLDLFSATLGSRSFENRLKFEYYVGATGLFKRNGLDLFGDITGSNSTLPDSQALAVITPYDTVISMVVDPRGLGGGDLRLNAGGNATFCRVDQAFGGTAPREVILTTPLSSNAYFPRPTAQAQWHSFSTRMPFATGYISKPADGSNFVGFFGAGTNAIGQLGNSNTATNFQGYVGGDFGTAQTFPRTGDWTSAPGNHADGGFLTRPDQDYPYLYAINDVQTPVLTPYFETTGVNSATTNNYFSPNRQVPSPVLLGSLPSSMTQGWQTLTFCPNPAKGSNSPGLQTPPDHLLLDMFWMPVAEPYPISDQFSTAGKVNLNYSIVPFTYMERKTGLYALMKATLLTTIPTTNEAENTHTATAEVYKSHYYMRTLQASISTRPTIDIAETLKGFDDLFKVKKDVFHSASQLCSMFLVPTGQTYSTVSGGTFWGNMGMTSDTAREAPYDNLYSRVTTKSNTFTVHWRVQVLRKTPNIAADTWNEKRDRSVAELRGSTLMERYIDPNATNIPDYAAASPPANTPTLSTFYKWRTVSETYFQP